MFIQAKKSDRKTIIQDIQIENATKGVLDERETKLINHICLSALAFRQLLS